MFDWWRALGRSKSGGGGTASWFSVSIVTLVLFRDSVVRWSPWCSEEEREGGGEGKSQSCFGVKYLFAGGGGRAGGVGGGGMRTLCVT